MAETNEEVVRRLSADWERGDFAAGEGLFDPDVDFELRMGVEHAQGKGIEEMGRLWRSQLAQWSDWRTGGIEDLRTSGDRVLVENVIRGRGRHSEVEVERTAFAVFTFRDHLVTRLVLIADRDEAFAEAGIDV